MDTAHRQWLKSEYEHWVDALRESTVHNFKEHPMIKRMLGEVKWPVECKVDLSIDDLATIQTIDNIGWTIPPLPLPGACWRMIWYANQVLYRCPISIIEIGGGVGEFYAILRAMGYRGEYYIVDLPPVKVFQYKYLREVNHQTGLHVSQVLNYDFCVSFYALGEFDNETKDWYIDNVVNRCPHGFVVWNPHSGASPEVGFRCTIKDEYPLLAEGNKQLEW